MHRQPRRYMFLLCFVSDWLSSDMPVAYCTFTLSHDTLFAKNSHNSIHFLPFLPFYFFYLYIMTFPAAPPSRRVMT